jgi:hypothetical protein
VVEVLSGEFLGEHVIIGLATASVPHALQDRSAIGREVDRLGYYTGGFQSLR